MTIEPAASITSTAASIDGATSTIFPPSISTSPRSMSAVPGSSVISRPPRIRVRPLRSIRLGKPGVRDVDLGLEQDRLAGLGPVVLEEVGRGAGEQGAPVLAAERAGEDVQAL